MEFVIVLVFVIVLTGATNYLQVQYNAAVRELLIEHGKELDLLRDAIRELTPKEPATPGEK